MAGGLRQRKLPHLAATAASLLVPCHQTLRFVAPMFAVCRYRWTIKPSRGARSHLFRRVCLFQRALWAVLLVGLLPAGRLTANDSDFRGESFAFFENHIRPLLVEHCYECHSGEADKVQASLRVDHSSRLLSGGDSGPAIVPGDADASLLIESVRYESYEMPPRGKLSEDQIALLVRWVEMGAPWPDEPQPEDRGDDELFDLPQRKASHWAWQPIDPLPAPGSPQAAAAGWDRDPIDRWIFHALEQAGRRPAPPVDPHGLVRRLHFDLVGLPPTPETLQQFLADPSPAALRRLVDRLLQSPRFGERWGRHWLDLVRYAESRGHEFDHDAVNAFQYRDYVVRAFNADVPYDRFVTEQIAGDLLDPPRLHPQTGANESVLGTGFWHLGEWVHSPVDTRKDQSDRFDNMIDVMSKTFLGMTVACARCHDHKFDAISTADYYALSGFLQSSDFGQVRFESIEANRRVARRLADVDRQHREAITALLRQAEIAMEPAEATYVSAGRASSDGQAEPATDDASVLVDYARLTDQPWRQNGFLFGPQPLRAGQLVLQPAGDVAEGDVAKPGRDVRLRVADASAASSDPFWNVLESTSEGGTQHRGKLASVSTAGRTLRSPTFTLGDGDVRILVRGQGTLIACVDSHRLIAGPLHGATVVNVPEREGWQWVRMNLGRYIGHRFHLEFVPDEAATLDVAVVLQGATSDQLARIEQWQRDQARSAGQLQQQIDALLAAGQGPADRVGELVQRWARRRGQLQQELVRHSHLAMAMLDGSGVDAQVLIRGNTATPGRLVQRRFLEAIDGAEPLEIAAGSGRLELARRITAADNPLTSRVIVNRLWHHLMGRGIVATTDDFGVLGQPPTHPELLDHLAASFRSDGQSIKRLIRRIVLTQAYQMSGRIDPQALEADPDNRLWHHRPPRRLEGEVLRDSLLAVAGRLDTAVGGPAVPIHLTPFMDGRGRPKNSGPLDGDGRRSLYIAVRRNFLSPMMLAFDMPVPFSTMGRRNVSNVPAQALILMNDPLVITQAKLWAQRTLAWTPSTGPTGQLGDATIQQQRIGRMYLQAFARPPSSEELRLAVDFLRGDSDDSGDATLQRWSDLAHALINTKEFFFLR